jgi:hypothetical protein
MSGLLEETRRKILGGEAAPGFYFSPPAFSATSASSSLRPLRFKLFKSAFISVHPR